MSSTGSSGAERCTTRVFRLSSIRRLYRHYARDLCSDGIGFAADASVNNLAQIAPGVNLGARISAGYIPHRRHALSDLQLPRRWHLGWAKRRLGDCQSNQHRFWLDDRRGVQRQSADYGFRRSVLGCRPERRRYRHGRCESPITSPGSLKPAPTSALARALASALASRTASKPTKKGSRVAPSSLFWFNRSSDAHQLELTDFTS